MVQVFNALQGRCAHLYKYKVLQKLEILSEMAFGVRQRVKYFRKKGEIFLSLRKSCLFLYYVYGLLCGALCFVGYICVVVRNEKPMSRETQFVCEKRRNY